MDDSTRVKRLGEPANCSERGGCAGRGVAEPGVPAVVIVHRGLLSR